jgi:hypothetical protein
VPFLVEVPVDSGVPFLVEVPVDSGVPFLVEVPVDSGVPFPVEVPVGAAIGSPKMSNRSWCNCGRISGRLQQSGRRLTVFVVTDVLAHLDASWIPAAYLALTVPLA